LASDGWCRRSNISSIKSLVLDKETMRPSHWLGLLLCVSFTELTLLDATAFILFLSGNSIAFIKINSFQRNTIKVREENISRKSRSNKFVFYDKKQ